MPRLFALGLALLTAVAVHGCVRKSRPAGEASSLRTSEPRAGATNPTEGILKEARRIVAEAQGAWVLTNAIHEAALLAARNLLTVPRGLTSDDIPLDLLRDAALDCIDEAPVRGSLPYTPDQLVDAARSLGQQTGLRDLPAARTLLTTLLNSTQSCGDTLAGSEALEAPGMTPAGRRFSESFLEQVHEVRVLFEATPAGWESLQGRLTDDMNRLTGLHPSLDSAQRQGASRRQVAAAREALDQLLTNEFQSLLGQVPDQRDLAESDLIDLDTQIQEFLGDDPFLGLY